MKFGLNIFKIYKTNKNHRIHTKPMRQCVEYDGFLKKSDIIVLFQLMIVLLFLLMRVMPLR